LVGKNLAEIRINLEEGNGLYYAHVADFLGSFAKATTKSKAIDGILADVKDYSEECILKIEPEKIDKEYKLRAKEYLKGINQLKIIEEIHGIEKLGEPFGNSALFKTDQEQLPEEKFEFFLVILKQLPEIVVRLAFELSEEDLNAEIIPGRKTIQQELVDFYTSESYYLSRFGEQIEQKFLEAINLTRDELESLSLLERIVRVRQGSIAILRIYYPKLGDQTFYSEKQTDFPDEPWTFKKIIRRYIEFDRERIQSIKELIAVLKEKQKQKKPTTEETTNKKNNTN
jgi:hypothetical protein